MKFLSILAALFVLCANSTPALAQVAPSPRLSVQVSTNQTVRLAWPETAESYALEEASALNDLAPWTPVSQNSLLQDGEFSVILNVSQASRFFRLRIQGHTTISDTSPAEGEQGVAVTRETVLRFTRPLAASTMLTANHLYAEFGGRKILSRIELSSDRRTVTLFYLENLPASARLRVTFNPIALLDFAGQLVDVDGDGQPGGIKLIDFDTLGTTPIGGTAVIGNVFASDPVPGTNTTNFINRPLAGVTITVDGMEETLRTVTDSNGFFRLMPCPAGEFFVHIDGRTLTNVAAGIRYPDLSYYPVVGKAWTAAAGETNNLAGGTGLIYLPLIVQGTLQTVSTTNDTTLTFPPSVLSNNPALAGVMITVPANSLFSANGTRGGSVGIAPVPPDRLPGPLPPGLNFPLVITVQTSGPENFDRPVPVRFPNLPDPITGERLPPGAKTALWSFNHDTGFWEVVGSMTVSADGLYVDSDPGVGILQPGWHGSSPGCPGNGGKIRPKKKKKPCPTEGASCNDGDDCTKNDKCQNGECVGTPPAGAAGNPCPGSAPTPVDFSGWTETTSGTRSVTTPSDIEINVQTCFDSSSGKWKQIVTSFKSLGNVNFQASGYTVPNPTVGGNVNAGNYCEIIADLRGFAGVPGTLGKWHTLEALQAHEYYHRDVEYSNHFKALWPTAEAALESGSVPCSKTLQEAAAILQKSLNKTSAKLWKDFNKERAKLRRDHDRYRNDGPYLEAQDVLDRVAIQVEQFAQSQSFPPCPAPAPKSVSKGIGEAVSLVSITVAPSAVLLSPGETRPIIVTGEYSDGSISNLTLAAATLYTASRPAIANVSPQGAISANSPGEGPIQILAFPESGRDPAIAIVDVTVRSPDDFDDDGMPDSWETTFGLNPNDASDADKDADGDGVTNIQEYKLSTGPRTRDSDADGMTDGQEVIEGSNPNGPAVPDPTPQTGLHYYAILNLDTFAVQRGIAGSDGTAFKNLILAPNSHYRQFILQAATLDVGSSDFTTPNSGVGITLPAIPLEERSTVDSDADGLPDNAEWIMGTDEADPDTDNDGILDGAEVQQGTDPASNVPVRTGILGSADTPGRAVDVCALNDIAIVADSAAGITLFSIGNGFNPTRLAQVDTPGNAISVACSGDLVAVGDDVAGLAIIDVSDPPAARIIHQLNLGSAVRAVAASGGIAYAGLASGQIVSVDMASGMVLERVTIGGTLQDVAVGGDALYALTLGTLHALPLNGDALHVSGTVSSPGGGAGGGRRLRLFIGSAIGYASHTSGYNTFNLADPFHPVLIQQRTTSQFGWKQIIANGSGFGLAAVGVNSTDDGAHDVSLYDLGPAGTNNQFVTTFATPGLAAAVSIYNGLAYVADSFSGLQVINYIAYDAFGVPPTISLSTSFPISPAVAEEGKPVRVTASVTDDVQVRNVEFYVDSVRAATDGNFPFEHRFVTPLLTTNRTNFTVRARGTDTGGNATWSQEIIVTLVPDATPPVLAQVFPAPGAILGQSDLVVAYFNEPIAQSTLSAATFQLRSAGTDGLLDTADDTFLTSGTISYREEFNAAFMNFETNLPPALYRGYVNPPLADLTGNALLSSFKWQFWITGGIDTDQDGIPDDVEIALSLDRFDPDTDNDGILDGDEDFDADGLVSKWELLFGYDPRVRDTDGNGFFDGDEDLDNDGLTNLQEQVRRTDARNPDTDQDGWWDEPEVTGASDPLNPVSTPRLFLVSRPPLGVVLPRSLGSGGLGVNVTIAKPSVAVVLPSATGPGSLPLNVIAASPPVSIVLPSSIGTALPPNVIVARPPVSVVLPSSIGASLAANIIVSQPPVAVRLPVSTGPGAFSNNVTIAQPPTKVHFASP